MVTMLLFLFSSKVSTGLGVIFRLGLLFVCSRRML